MIKMRPAFTRYFLLIALFFLGQYTVYAQPLAPENRAEFEALIREYIMNHPELVREALIELDLREQQEAERRRIETIAQASRLIFDSEHQMVVGNPDGEITLVEFYDYNCGFCRRAAGDMLQLLEENRNIRFVLKELPILGEGSREAANISIAVGKLAPMRFLEFHTRLLLSGGRANQNSAMTLAREMGLDVDAIMAFANSPAPLATITEVQNLAANLGIEGTPAYVVGDEVLGGAVGYERLKAKITAMLKTKS